MVRVCSVDEGDGDIVEGCGRGGEHGNAELEVKQNKAREGSVIAAQKAAYRREVRLVGLFSQDREEGAVDKRV